jgi:UDP-N-acetylglucosamine transferase subunit ALG13
MILVTVGTNEQPFDRLIRAVEPLELEESLVVQHGSCATAGGRGRWVDFVPFEELEALMREARIVVAHAGVGSVMLARQCGKRPMVVPRRLHLGEAVDDHQLPIARRLHASGAVELVEQLEDLPGMLGATSRTVHPDGGEAALPDALALATDVREYLEGILNVLPVRSGAQQVASPQ